MRKEWKELKAAAEAAEKNFKEYDKSIRCKIAKYVNNHFKEHGDIGEFTCYKGDKDWIPKKVIKNGICIEIKNISETKIKTRLYWDGWIGDETYGFEKFINIKIKDLEEF